MTKKSYVAKMKKHENTFDKLWIKIANDTNKFVAKNPNVNMDSFNNDIRRFIDNLCLSGSWIHDKIENKGGIPSSPRYKRSLTKKIRRVLGYTY